MKNLNLTYVAKTSTSYKIDDVLKKIRKKKINIFDCKLGSSNSIILNIYYMPYVI